MPNSKVYNIDCMEYMKTVPDKYFELAIVDPPYGIGASEMTMGKGKRKAFPRGKHWDDSPPDDNFFKELFRVSKNSIIFGGNYFHLPISRGWIFWDKGLDGKTSFADGELAWTSFDVSLRKANIRYDGFLGADKDGRIHNTQKPVALYTWILKNYAKEGDKIFDSHLGSGSSRIAAYDMGFDFVGCELDKYYYDKQEERFNNHIAQYNLFLEE